MLKSLTVIISEIPDGIVLDVSSFHYLCFYGDFSDDGRLVIRGSSCNTSRQGLCRKCDHHVHVFQLVSLARSLRRAITCIKLMLKFVFVCLLLLLLLVVLFVVVVSLSVCMIASLSVLLVSVSVRSFPSVSL